MSQSISLEGIFTRFVAATFGVVARLSLHNDRSFPVAAARTWNSLPPSVTVSQSLQTFRKRLKTELFQRSYTTASLP